MPTGMTDPFEPILKLGERLMEEAQKLGLRVENVAIVPNFHGGPHALQVMYAVEDEQQAFTPNVQDPTAARDAVQLSPEEEAIFGNLMFDDKKKTDEDKFEEARKKALDLQKRLEQGGDGGILGDD